MTVCLRMKAFIEVLWGYVRSVMTHLCVTSDFGQVMSGET